MNLLITGGCGFLGSNLGFEALARKYELVILDNLSRHGSTTNLKWLRSHGSFRFINSDMQDEAAVRKAVQENQPDAIFHLAGQVAMTTSIADPRSDFLVNAAGTLNVLEAVRLYAPQCAVIYSSTNKVYGDLEQFSYSETATRFICPSHPHGFDELTPLSFHSPYGCSKGSADQYMLDYARIFGLKTIVFRHSSMYGERQFATFDQGWVGWFCQKAIEHKNGSKEWFTISGSGKQVRDVLHADDMIRLYYQALECAEANAGEAFNIGGGVQNSLSLLELFSLLQDLIGGSLNYTALPPRSSDQKVFVADIRKANKAFGWSPRIDARSGVSHMLEWIQECKVPVRQ
jgi:CDP-paratose 2-epimerase